MHNCALKLAMADFYYSANDLGITYYPQKTFFKIWAPVATKVAVLIFNRETDFEPEDIVFLNKGIKGTWETEITGDLAGKYYLFRIFNNNQYRETIDPYAKAVGTDSKNGLIVDLVKTNPPGWETDRRVNLKNPVDAVIYELHVRDFSMSPESGMNYKGKYLAFTERTTTNKEGYRTGIEHLKELGITHVHLLPVFDFASVSDHGDEYNWGYDPYYYNVPEGSYATDPATDSRIIELKKMIKMLHENDIGVIMDVVYNHTYYTQKAAFNIIAPNYFYRFWQGKCANGSGCGNEIATEKPMVRKFIIDSLKYWTQEYHIDGFRFDLMGLIDKETINLVEKTLHKIDPAILIYGEPWYALPPQLEQESQIYKGFQKNKKIAVFNDHFRDAIKGSTNGSDQGFVSGTRDYDLQIKQGIVGGIKYNEKITDFTYSAAESVNYVSCHDNLTLWDKLSLSNPEDEERIRIKMARLAQAIVFTSQGIPFIQGGAEFLRTKYKKNNSYNAGDYFNQLKWERKTKYYDTFKYFRGLISLRKQHPAFRMSDPEQIRKHLEFLSGPRGTIAFRLKDFANGDCWEEIIVIYNANQDWAYFKIDKTKKWGIVVDDDQAGVRAFNVFKADNVNVPGISAMVLHSM